VATGTKIMATAAGSTGEATGIAAGEGAETVEVGEGAIDHPPTEHTVLVLGLAYPWLHIDQLEALLWPLDRNLEEVSYTRSVVFVLGDVTFERSPFSGHEHVVEGTEGHFGRPV
jgi:hypothetical protein